MSAKSTHRYGETFVWFTASALSAITILAVTFILIILANALGFFWPSDVTKFQMDNDRFYLGEIAEEQGTGDNKELRIKIGNRDLYGQDFVWIDAANITSRNKPEDVVALERMEYGNFYGHLDSVDWDTFQTRLDAIREQKAAVDAQHNELMEINAEIEALEEKRVRLIYDQGETAAHAEEINDLKTEIEQLRSRFEADQTKLLKVENELHAETAVLRDVGGQTTEIELVNIARAWRPNAMGVIAKSGFYGSKVVELLVEQPRESNTEGGIFPAIFGTVLMVFLMSIFAIPFGVVAAIYLREYAKEGRMVTLVRVSVNNLAGVPSIVYGVFGLGFFIYTVGSGLDQMFFPHRLPTPTFGTGGILWASLTLALLTVPVVIVSTEEALSAIPKEIREGSLGLGATKFQTLVRILIPMSTPGILTGLILAMARAAGEVAPLMLTGAVKLAPELPLDSSFPYLHLDRKFMHLGFHIYDLGFQSPNVEAVLPMVYVTTTLLLLLVILLSVVAIVVRNRMRDKYNTGVF